MWKCSLDLKFLSVLLTMTYLSLFDSFHILYWKVSYKSGISNILGAPVQFRFYLQSLMQWLLWSSLERLPSHTSGLSGLFFCLEGRFHKPFLVFLSLKSENHKAYSANFYCLMWLGHDTLLQLHLLQISVINVALHCLSFSFFLQFGILAECNLALKSASVFSLYFLPCWTQKLVSYNFWYSFSYCTAQFVFLLADMLIFIIELPKNDE